MGTSEDRSKAWLAVSANLLAALLALTTIVVYLAVYTPMKRRSAAATLVGAIPGALPPLIGWAAAQNNLSVGGWTLFLILFLWQIPHFMAIAWLYREDYARAGFPMLPIAERLRRTEHQAVLSAAFAAQHAAGARWRHRPGLLLGRPGARRRAAGALAHRSAPIARRGCLRLDHYLPLISIAMVPTTNVTVDLPAVNATLNGISGVLLLIWLCLIQRAASAASPVHAGGVCHILALPAVLRDYHAQWDRCGSRARGSSGRSTASF
jgi:hypothetical protein